MSKSIIEKYVESIQTKLNKPDEPLRSSVRQIENYLESTVWNDFETLILENIEYLRTQLEVKEDINEIRLIQGEIAGLKRILNLPVIAIESINQHNEDNEVKQTVEQQEGDNNA